MNIQNNSYDWAVITLLNVEKGVTNNFLTFNTYRNNIESIIIGNGCLSEIPFIVCIQQSICDSNNMLIESTPDYGKYKVTTYKGWSGGPIV